MKFAFALLATISWMGCGVDTAAPGTGGGDDTTGVPPGTDPGNPTDPGDGTGPITEVSGHIPATTTWMGTIHVTASTIIDAKVTVTVLPGTTVDMSTGTGITVSGVLDLQGTKASKVVFRPATTGEFWTNIVVPAGGVLKASYLVQTSGGLYISGTGKATLVDSQLSHAGGDLLTMLGGTLDMTYSAIGLETGRDTTHCNMHVSSSPVIKASHSNISTASYGIMFYGGVNADFTYDNWFGNSIDIATDPPHPVTGNLSYSYFAKGNPTYAGFTVTNMATSRVADAGVR